MPDTVTIRSAEPADAPRLAELSGVLGYPVGTEALAGRLQRLLGRAEETVLVAELSSGQVVGWLHATEQTMRHLPGFVSASIHKSRDGTKVVNYAQWRSQQDFDAMRQDPTAKPHMAAAAALATFEPILCDVVESIGEP